jgi:hypothetical protein
MKLVLRTEARELEGVTLTLHSLRPATSVS